MPMTQDEILEEMMWHCAPGMYCRNDPAQRTAALMAVARKLSAMGRPLDGRALTYEDLSGVMSACHSASDARPEPDETGGA